MVPSAPRAGDLPELAQKAIPEYGHIAISMFVSQPGPPGVGSQSKNSGQLAACWQPQPQAFWNGIVFGAHLKWIVWHSIGVFPMYP
jgi:hypothetical protein